MLRILSRALATHSAAGQSQLRSMSSAAAATPTKQKWDLYAGVLVERLPVVSKPLTSLEVEYQVCSNILNTLHSSIVLY